MGGRKATAVFLTGLPFRSMYVEAAIGFLCFPTLRRNAALGL